MTIEIQMLLQDTDSKKKFNSCKVLKLFEFLAKWVLYTYLLQKLFFFKTDTIRRIWISILRKFMALAWKEKKITRDFSLSCCYYNSFFFLFNIHFLCLQIVFWENSCDDSFESGQMLAVISNLSLLTNIILDCICLDLSENHC